MPAQPASVMRLPSLARKLVAAGLFTEDKAQEALEQAGKKGRTFTSHIVREKLVDMPGYGSAYVSYFCPARPMNRQQERIR